jgi:hypothetical protein
LRERQGKTGDNALVPPVQDLHRDAPFHGARESKHDPLLGAQVRSYAHTIPASPRARADEGALAVFEEYNSSVITYAAALPTPGAQVLVADAEGAKYVFSNKRAFGKPVEDYA